MSEVFRRLSGRDLRALGGALRTERLGPPFNAFALRRVLSGSAGEVEEIAGELGRIAGLGASPPFMAEVVEMIAAERDGAAERRDRIELVWTGPALAGETSRDTGVVVREMFASAQHSVVVAGFAVYQGKEIFRALAERMDRLPGLEVRMFLNVARDGFDDVRGEGAILAEFVADFRSRQWPGNRLPNLFYDPRSLVIGGGVRASMHAKCVVVDGEDVLVTSANFTEAAHSRNIEAGVRIRDSALAGQLTTQLVRMVEAHLLRQIQVR